MKVNQEIGKYRIISIIGRGASGRVYKAEDIEIGRLVAIKVLDIASDITSAMLGKGKDELKRFQVEAKAAGRLKHPSIVTVYDTGRTRKGEPFIAMELLDGSTLDKQIATTGKIDPIKTLHYLSQIASCVDYAHSEGVVHKDIKPANISIDEQGKASLLDFGVASIGGDGHGTMVGTPSYMSPEQLRGQKLSSRVDIFSLSIVAFECLTGSRPFLGVDFSSVASSIIQKNPLSFDEVESDLPQNLEVSLHKGLARNPDERWGSASGLISSMANSLGVELSESGVKGFTPEMQWCPSMIESSDLSLMGKEERASTDTLGRLYEKASIVDSGLVPAEGLDRFDAEEVSSLSRLPFLNLKPLKFGLCFLLGIIGFASVYQFLGGDAESVQVDDLPQQVELSSEKVTSELPKIEPVAPVSSGVDFFNQPFQLKQLTTEELAWALAVSDEETESLWAVLGEIEERGTFKLLPNIHEKYSSGKVKGKIEILKLVSHESFYGQPGSAKMIVEALRDNDYLVRGFAAKLSTKFNAEMIEEALKQRLEVEENDVVRQVIKTAISGVS